MTVMIVIFVLLLGISQGGSVDVCYTQPAGISDLSTILDYQLTASTQYGSGYQAAYGRLNGGRGNGWCAKESSRTDDWLQVDLGKTVQLCGVATQGDIAGNEWVTDFKLSYSTDGNTWTTYKDGNDAEVEFHRAGDSNTVDQHKLPVEVVARFIRFHPTKQNAWNCLRVEAYGTVLSSGSVDICYTQPAGISDLSKIPDNQLTASTQYGSGYQAAYGRLNGGRGDGWCAKESSRTDDWLQVDLGTAVQLCAVATQGDIDGNEWVTDFKLSYSSNGSNWTTYKDGNGAEVEFHRAGDSGTVDHQKLPVEVVARFIRFHPTKQNAWNCLRVEAYGNVISSPVSVDVCYTQPAGISDASTIPDNQLTASTQYGSGHQAAYGRLNGGRGDGWCAKESSRTDDWLQVDLGTAVQLCAVATQGDINGNEWVTDFKLSYSTDGNTWTTYKDGNGAEVEFHRAGDSNTVDQHKLPVEVVARFIRFHPTKQNGWNCLRVEAYGTAYMDVCYTHPAGISDLSTIPDNQLTASTQHGSGYQAAYGRLNGSRGDGWCAKESSRTDDWLQVDFGTAVQLCGVATQGDIDGSEWVTVFKLSYSTDGNTWTTYKDGNGAEVEFYRAGDSNTVDQHKLPWEVGARFIRFHPTKQNAWNCLRVEAYGNELQVEIEDECLIMSY